MHLFLRPNENGNGVEWNNKLSRDNDTSTPSILSLNNLQFFKGTTATSEYRLGTLSFGGKYNYYGRNGEYTTAVPAESNGTQQSSIGRIYSIVKDGNSHLYLSVTKNEDKSNSLCYLDIGYFNNTDDTPAGSFKSYHCRIEAPDH